MWGGGNKKQYIFFIIGGLLSVILYIICISIYIRLANIPIIFFASIIISIIVSLLTTFIINIKKIYEKFTIVLVNIIYFLILIIISVFGPVFIERSISYHIAFLAAENTYISREDVENEFVKEIFDKRMYDATIAGFLTKEENGTYKSTMKSKIFYSVLYPLGEITGSLETYKRLKKQIKQER